MSADVRPRSTAPGCTTGGFMSDRTPLRITAGALGLGAMLAVSALAGAYPAAAAASEAAASEAAPAAPAAQVQSWVTDLASGQRLAAQAPQRWRPGPAPAGPTVV